MGTATHFLLSLLCYSHSFAHFCISLSQSQVNTHFLRTSNQGIIRSNYFVSNTMTSPAEDMQGYNCPQTYNINDYPSIKHIDSGISLFGRMGKTSWHGPHVYILLQPAAHWGWSAGVETHPPPPGRGRAGK